MTIPNKPTDAISEREALNKNNEKYRQEADYYQLVAPIEQSIKALDLEHFINLISEEYRYREELKRRRKWREAPGRHVSQGMLWEYSGRAIYKYAAHPIQLTLNALCVEGSDSDSLTLRFGGEDTLRSLRAHQREKKPVGLLGADQFNYLIEKHRSHLRELWFAKYEAGKRLVATPRLYLADRLKHSCKIVNLDLQKAVRHLADEKYPAPTLSITPPGTLVEYRACQAGQMTWTAYELGQLLGCIDYFNRCLYDFHEAERQSVSAPLAASAVVPEEAGTKQKPAAMQVAFDHYIKEEYREKLLPFLAREYAGQKPQEIACMLIALKDLAALTYPLQSNVTVLHAALDAFLKGAGTRQSLADNLTKLNKASQKEHIKIQTHCARIKTYMEQG